MTELLHVRDIRSLHELKTKTQDGKDLYIGSGWVLFGLTGSPGGAWNYRDLRFDVGPQWVQRPIVVPTVALASIMDANVANNAGWAIDDCAVEFPENNSLFRCHLICRIGVRDVDAIMYRVTYHVAMLGQIK